MARELVVCPGCGARLEAGPEDVGRDGECPACRRVFTIVPGREHVGLGSLLGVPGLAAALALLAALVHLRWVDPEGGALRLVSTYKAVLLGACAACLAFTAFSVVVRCSIVPAVLATAACGSAAVAVVAGLGRCLSAASSAGAYAAPLPGLYKALGAAVALFGAAGYAYVQYRRALAQYCSALVFAGFAATGLVAGLVAAGLHIGPACAALAEQARARREYYARAGAAAVAPREWAHGEGHVAGAGAEFAAGAESARGSGAPGG